MSAHILEADSIQKSYANKLILSDVYLKCHTGEIMGLLGRNGSGKSTLLKIIFGIVAADFKFIRIDGAIKSQTAHLLKEISYLNQDSFIPQNLSVAKAISLSIMPDKIDGFYNDAMIEAIKNKKVAHLSSGELRYLEIKIVLSKDSKFALLDEPYNGLAPMMIDQINALVIANSASKGIIITDHNYENVIKVSTRLVLMHDGKTRHLGDKNQLVDFGYLREGMFH